MKIKNYIIAHKNFKVPQLEGYVPIQVGAEGKDDLGFIKDNLGDNISEKNPNYCELTGMYWVWKNDKDSDIIGISHYRRYFANGFLLFKKIINQDKIEKLIKKYDVIVAKKEIYRENVYMQYCNNSGFAKDLELVKRIIKEKFSNEYEDAFNKVMSSNKISQYNMMIAKRETYSEYCQWLFEILFEVEKKADLTDYNDYQKRIYGFLAERLLNVWLLANNNLKVKKLLVINTESTFEEKLKIRLRRIKNNIIFYANKKK